MNKTFVFDTNVLMSSHFLKASINTKALILARKIGNVVSTSETFKEFTNCFLSSRFDGYLTIEKRKSDIVDLESTMKFITIKESLAICRDPYDNKFLSLAVAADAACIITGDKGLLILNPYENLPILTPVQFLSYFVEFDDSLIINEPREAYDIVANALYRKGTIQKYRLT